MLAGQTALAGFVGQAGAGGSFWAEISTDNVSKTGGTRGSSRTLTTEAVVVTPHGGSGSPSYSWVRISGDAGIAASTPSAASTTFTATLSVGDELSAVFTCTVTDGSGARQVLTATVTMTLVDYGSTL